MKTLVIVCAGDNSLHPSWLPDRGFDLWVSYFGDHDGRFRQDADAYQQQKGFKFPTVHELVQCRRSEIEAYDFIALPDDDMAWTAEKFHQAFELMRQHSLDVAQPGITGAGTDFRHLLAKPGSVGRLVDFVEIRTPLFSRAALAKVLWTFNESQSGWGIDILWSVKYPEHRMAVLDQVPVGHTRLPRSGELHQNLAKAGGNPLEELRAVLARHHLPLTLHCRELGVLQPAADGLAE
jgi:hypothetical protein